MEDLLTKTHGNLKPTTTETNLTYDLNTVFSSTTESTERNNL